MNHPPYGVMLRCVLKLTVNMLQFYVTAFLRTLSSFVKLGHVCHMDPGMSTTYDSAHIICLRADDDVVLLFGMCCSCT
jgi:hypothetical protein